MEKSDSPKSDYEIENDYSYATARSRVLETKIREPELMDPGQVLREYGLEGKDIDAALEELMEAGLREFEESAPEAVAPFRLMADLGNIKAFLRNKRTDASMSYSALGSFEIPETKEELGARLREKGLEELADRLGVLLSQRQRDADIYLENHFAGLIKNQFFLDYLKLQKNYLESDETPQEFYSRLARFVKEKYVMKNMDADVPTGFLLLRQRELTLARAKAVKDRIGE